MGAGDAMVAGAIAGALRGLSASEAAALATAFASVAIGQVGPGLDTGAVREAAGSVVVREVPRGDGRGRLSPR